MKTDANNTLVWPAGTLGNFGPMGKLSSSSLEMRSTAIHRFALTMRTVSNSRPAEAEYACPNANPIVQPLSDAQTDSRGSDSISSPSSTLPFRLER
jgi:hypothetical protein